ncbi:hypothetical protein KCV01_g25465, partial [Aureobasidium melanogenum]
EVRTGGEIDRVGEVERRRGVQRGVATDRQGARAERAVVAQHQAAGIERHAAAEGICATQGLDARAVLHEPTRTHDEAVVDRVADTAEGQRAAAQRHGAAGDTRERTDGLRTRGGDVEARGRRREVDRASRGEATAQADRKRAGVDRRAAGKCVGARQRLGTGAFFDQAAGAADGTAEGAVGRSADRQRVGAHVHRAAAGESAEGLRAVTRRQIQRGVGGQVHRAGRCEAGARAERQRARIDVRAPRIGVDAIEGERRRALLGESTRTRQLAVEGERVGAQHGKARVERDVVG